MMHSPKRAPVAFNFNALFKPTTSSEPTICPDDKRRLSNGSMETTPLGFSSYATVGLWGNNGPASSVLSQKNNYSSTSLNSLHTGDVSEVPSSSVPDYAHTHAVHVAGISDTDSKSVSEQARSLSCRSIEPSGYPTFPGYSSSVFTFYDSRNAKCFVTNLKNNAWMQSLQCTPLKNQPVDNIMFEIPRNVLSRFYNELRQTLESYGDVALLTTDSKNVLGFASRETASIKQYVVCKFYDTRAINNILAAQAIKVSGFTLYPQLLKITPEILGRLDSVEQNVSLMSNMSLNSPNAMRSSGAMHSSGSMHSSNGLHSSAAFHSPSGIHTTGTIHPSGAMHSPGTMHSPLKQLSLPVHSPPQNFANQHTAQIHHERRNSFFGTSSMNMHDAQNQQNSHHHNPPAPPHHHHNTWADNAQLHSPIASVSSIQSSLGSPVGTVPGYRAPPRNNSVGENSIRGSKNPMDAMGGSVSSVDSMSSASSIGSLDRDVEDRKELDNLFKKFDIQRAPGHSNAPAPNAKKLEKVSVPRIPSKSDKGGGSCSEGGNNSDASQAFIDIGAISRGQDKRCTVMVRNIPNKLGFQDFKKFIDSTSKNEYDFLYLRFDFANRCNVGYAFVSFSSPKYVKKFVQKRSGMRWNQHHHNSGKVIELRYAKIQGYENLIEKFRYSPVMSQDESFRPRFYHSSGPLIGQEITFSE